MQSDDLLNLTIDKLMQEAYPATEPGVAVIVVKDGEKVLRKAYGMANLELEVPLQPDMVFRIGSITKQFTAVAILMLVEQGKLALDDSILRFLPDYPTHDHLITIEHLLTHTSGIRSYTDMPEWYPLQRKDFTPQELIVFFQHQPMQFSPGKRWAYNNSAYVLLGVIIEQVSGQSYEQFIQQNIFDPLGMKHSYYDNPLHIIPRRVAGYFKGTDGYMNTAYLSMTQPYSAGALASTLDDLALWDAALYTEQLVRQESLQCAFHPYRLLDGSSTRYGYGWGVSEYKGHRLIEHSGGINGFRSIAIRLPDDHIFVALLSNNASGADIESMALEIATLAIGQPYAESMSVELSSSTLVRYEGEYMTSSSEKWHITSEGNQLFAAHADEPRKEVAPVTADKFAFKDRPLARLRFVSDTNGVITSLELDGRYGPLEVAKRIDTSISKTS